MKIYFSGWAASKATKKFCSNYNATVMTTFFDRLKNGDPSLSMLRVLKGRRNADADKPKPTITRT